MKIKETLQLKEALRSYDEDVVNKIEKAMLSYEIDKETIVSEIKVICEKARTLYNDNSSLSSLGKDYLNDYLNNLLDKYKKHSNLKFTFRNVSYALVLYLVFLLIITLFIYFDCTTRNKIFDIHQMMTGNLVHELAFIFILTLDSALFYQINIRKIFYDIRARLGAKEIIIFLVTLGIGLVLLHIPFNLSLFSAITLTTTSSIICFIVYKILK